jgi:protein-disulfide isomerase
VERLKQDVAADEIRDKILGDQRSGTRAGVRSTPSLFVDGRLVLRNPGSVTELVRLVAEAGAE